jgi:hypothetical protein
MKHLLISLSLLLFIGCSDKPITKLYENATQEPITCLRLYITPANLNMEQTMKELYPFNPTCPVILEVKHKENICCNSNQNIVEKTCSPFPHHFLRLEVRRGFQRIYSYYIDLHAPADKDDLIKAFKQMQHDLSSLK